jgi:nitrous oxidase accessory protein
LWAFFHGICFSKIVEVGKDLSFNSVETGLKQLSAFDTLLIHPGHYEEDHLIIDKPVWLIGIDFPVIFSKTGGELFTVIADSVSISGLQIENILTSYLEDRAAIRIKRSSFFEIRGNRLFGTFFGVYLENCSEGKVIDNQIIGNAIMESSSGNAIHAWYCKKLRIENNLVSKHRDGIYFEFVDQSLIRGNISKDNLRYGLHFMFSNEDDYIENEFKNNGAGVAVMFSKKINMYSNRFLYNWGNASYGLLLKEIYDAEIKNNLFKRNTIGIYIEGSTRINYRQNDFLNNGWALKFSGGCLDNKVEENNFLSNTFDLSVIISTGSNIYDGNYWSDYNGYDLDKDGIGDVPYRPVKLFNYLINNTPETIVLLRSFFVELLNFAEKISPIFTPAEVMDKKPSMKVLSSESEKIKLWSE